MLRFRVTHNDNGLFTGTYDGAPHLEAEADSFAEALELIQDLVDDADMRAEVCAGDDDFYG